MSLRVWNLTAPDTYDTICMCNLVNNPDLSATVVVRYLLNNNVVADTDETVEISVADVASWDSDWNPSTHARAEHFLTKWVTAETKPAGTLGAMVKS